MVETIQGCEVEWAMNNNKPGPSYLPEVVVTIAMIFYGTSFVATKIALEVYNPITIITVRKVISAVLLMLFLLLRSGKKALPRRLDIKPLLLIAFFQPFIYFICETYGISMVEASLASIMIATIPVFTPVFARFFFDEGLNRYNYAGLVLSLVGVSVIVLSSRSGNITDFRPLGLLLMLGAVIAAVGYSIVVRKTSPSLSTLSITTWQNCFGALYLLPLFFALEFKTAAAQPLALLPVVSIIYLAVFPSSIAFLFMNHGIKTIGPTRTMVFTNLVPAVTALLSFAVLQEAFTVSKVLGMVIILSGVILSQKGSAQQPEAEEVMVDR